MRPVVSAFAIVALLSLAACDSGSVDCSALADCCTPGEDCPDVPFDPSTVDYDTVASTDFDAQVSRLLAARDVFSLTATTTPGALSAYTYDAVLMAGPSGFVVPFDAEGSLLVRFLEDLPADATLPLPNLRRLEPDEVRFLKRWIEAGAPGDHGPGFHHAAHLLFAAVQGENHVALLDAETLRIVRRVYLDDLELPSAPYGPHHVAFEPDGSAWYVTLVSAGRVVKLSTSLTIDPSDPAYVLGATPAGAFETPGMLALDPTSNRLFVGRSTLSSPLASGFAVVDRATMGLAVVETRGFSVPHAMAVTPDGRYVLTASLTGEMAAVYEATDDPTLVSELSLATTRSEPRELIHLALLDTPSAGTGYQASLTSRSTDEVLLLALSTEGQLSLAGVAPGGDGPYHAHLGHDGHTLLVPNWVGGTVTLVDALTQRVTQTIGAAGGPLSQPHSPAPAHDGSRFFVSSSNRDGAWAPPYLFRHADGRAATAGDFGNVAAFSITGSLLGVVQLGAYPSGLEPFTVGGGHH